MKHGVCCYAFDDMLEVWLSTVVGYLRGYVDGGSFGFAAVVRCFVKLVVFRLIVYELCEVFDGE